MWSVINIWFNKKFELKKSINKNYLYFKICKDLNKNFYKCNFLKIKKKYFVLKKNRLILFCLDKQKTDLYQIKSLIKGIIYGFKKYIRIKGYGYRFSLEKKFLIIDYGFSHKIYYKLPLNILIEISNKGKSLLLKSNNKNILYNFFQELKTLRKVNVYNAKGILEKGVSIITKPGKVYKR